MSREPLVQLTCAAPQLAAVPGSAIRASIHTIPKHYAPTIQLRRQPREEPYPHLSPIP